MGERRWRASQLAGTGTIPAIVRPTEDHDLLRDALLENLHRAQLNPLEEAAAYQQLLEDFGCTQDELAVRIKRSRPQISNTIRLLRLPPTVQRRVAAGVLERRARPRAARAARPARPGAARAAGRRRGAVGPGDRGARDAGGARPAGARRRKRGPREPSERARALVETLTDRLDTRVRVDAGRTRGRIVIEFASEDDLERIAALLVGRQLVCIDIRPRQNTATGSSSCVIEQRSEGRDRPRWRPRSQRLRVGDDGLGLGRVGVVAASLAFTSFVA